MAESIEDMSHEVFITYMATGVFTDQEIAEKIQSYPRPVSAKQRAELAETAGALKGGAVTGPIRTALRAIANLPPVPGDD